MTTKQKIAVVAAILGAGILVAALGLALWQPSYTVNGEKLPTDAKEVCQKLADESLESAPGEEDKPFTQEQYEDYTKWAKHIDDKEVSQSFLALGVYFKPDSKLFEDEGDIGMAFAVLAVYEDLSDACKDKGVTLPNVWADEGTSDDGWDMAGEEGPAPDTDRWLDNWCNVQMGDTYDQVIEKMGEPTSEMLEGEGDPQIAYDYSGYGFTIFFDTGDKVNSFWADYDSLGEEDLARLSCVAPEPDFGMYERKDMMF